MYQWISRPFIFLDDLKKKEKDMNMHIKHPTFTTPEIMTTPGSAMESNDDDTAVVCGVLFARSVRSSFASFSLAPATATTTTSEKNNSTTSTTTDDACPTLVRLQFMQNQIPELRSACRREFKLGARLQIKINQPSSSSRQVWKEPPTSSSRQQEDESLSPSASATNNWNQLRLVINLNSVDELMETVQILDFQCWTMKQCQAWQLRFFPNRREVKTKQRKQQQLERNDNADASHNQPEERHGCNNGLEKRQQAEAVAHFLIHAVMHKLAKEEQNEHVNNLNLLEDPATDWMSMDLSKFSQNDEQGMILFEKAINYLNTGSGVLDAAGGSGHVSFALALLGIKSTVIDPRPSAGKLPSRDRKAYNRGLKQKTVFLGKENNSGRSIPVVAYSTYRAWFGCQPVGVDQQFRNHDAPESTLPVCDNQDELVQNASAIIGLHPDEATGKIVEMATAARKPFVVVPCCVFCRLFPHRRVNDRLVSTYEDLLEFLKGYDASIQQTTLKFRGKNQVLWSMFETSPP